MKRAIALLLACLVCLAGCGRDVSVEGFYPDAYLAECRLYGMPIPAEDVRYWDGRAYCRLDTDALAAYTDALMQYLCEKDDIYYKGYYSETGNTAGILYAPEYRFAPLTAESDPSILWFAFSLTEELNDGDEFRLHYENGVSIRIRRDEGSFKKFKYNTVIEIKRDPTFLYYLGEK